MAEIKEYRVIIDIATDYNKEELKEVIDKVMEMPAAVFTDNDVFVARIRRIRPLSAVNVTQGVEDADGK